MKQIIVNVKIGTQTLQTQYFDNTLDALLFINSVHSQYPGVARCFMKSF